VHVMADSCPNDDSTGSPISTAGQILEVLRAFVHVILVSVDPFTIQVFCLLSFCEVKYSGDMSIF